MKKIIICLFVIVALCDAAKPVPKYIKTCNRYDPNINECFANNANLAMSYIGKGDKDYNINTLMPLNFRDILIVDMPPLKLILLEVIVFGAENMTIVDPIIDFDSKIIQFTLSNPQIIWKSKFVAIVEENGISVETNGHADLYFKNGKYAMLYEYNLHNINGQEYANITKFSSEFLTVRTDFQLNNLNTNPLIRREWEKMKKDFINDQVKNACAETVGEYINKILNVVPFNEIFPE